MDTTIDIDRPEADPAPAAVSTLSAAELLETAVIHDRKVFDRLRKDGPYGLGEAYEAGMWDADPLDQFMFRLFRTPEAREHGNPRLRILSRLALEAIVNPQRGAGAFRVGREHYSLGNDLFAMMLDDTMTYTCGYWPRAASLADAQTAKLELACRKLELEPGMRVLDIGCGWGNFARHAAERHGVSVVGITVSESQAEFARRNCAGLPVEIRLEDYADTTGTFDRIVSIEMIEAVGRRNLRTFFRHCSDRLADDGRFLLQAISAETFSRHSLAYLDLFVLWLATYTFPNGYLPKANELATPARSHFHIADWHEFTPSYDRTLQVWTANFNRGYEPFREQYGDRFPRRWNYYLQGCAAAFRARLGRVGQILYVKGAVPQDYQPPR